MKTQGNINIADEIKSRCNIVDVIGRVVELRKTGSNFKGLCPFHNEKTPSFVVSEQKQIFTCFGCGARGDVIEFTKRYYGLEFREAAEMLAREYGIDIKFSYGEDKDNESLYEINRKAARFFYKALRNGNSPGYEYMSNRGIDDETLKTFGIGYADDNWGSLYDYLKEEGYTDKQLLELGLVSEKNGRVYDKFRNRVMFPIINMRGKVIGFGGRIINQGEPKYLNSQESSIFRKKYNLYGFNLTKENVVKKDSAILVEGYMDVISLYMAGVKNVTASLGTALTEEQITLLKRYTKNVVLCYDSDEAGQNAAVRGGEIIYNAECSSRILTVTDGKDPDEYIKTHGKDEFEALVDEAVPYGDYKFSKISEKYDISDYQQKILFMKDAVKELRKMRAVEAEIYIKRLSETTGISEQAIRFEYIGNNSQERTKAFNQRSNKNEEYNVLSSLEQELLALMLMDKKYRTLPDDICDSVWGTVGRAIYESLHQMSGEKNAISLNEIRELVDDNVVTHLSKLEKINIPAEKEDVIYSECIKKIRKEILEKKQEDILSRLSLADESENKDEINNLTMKLMEIQKELKL